MKRHIIPVAVAALIAVAGCSSNETKPAETTPAAEASSSAPAEDKSSAPAEETSKPAEDKASESPSGEEGKSGEKLKDADVPVAQGKGADTPESAVKTLMTAMSKKDAELMCSVVENEIMTGRDGDIPCMQGVTQALAVRKGGESIDDFSYEVIEKDGETFVKTTRASGGEELEMRVVQDGGKWFVASNQD